MYTELYVVWSGLLKIRIIMDENKSEMYGYNQWKVNGLRKRRWKRCSLKNFPSFLFCDGFSNYWKRITKPCKHFFLYLKYCNKKVQCFRGKEIRLTTQLTNLLGKKTYVGIWQCTKLQMYLRRMISMCISD